MKNILYAILFCSLMSGPCFTLHIEAQAKKGSFFGMFSSEKRLWKRGLAAAKKRHWNREKLSKSELRSYNAVLKRVGIKALLALIGIGAYIILSGRNQKDATEINKELIEAAKQGDLVKVNGLLTRDGIDLSYTVDEKTAVDWAIENGHDAVVTRLQIFAQSKPMPIRGDGLVQNVTRIGGDRAFEKGRRRSSNGGAGASTSFNTAFAVLTEKSQAFKFPTQANRIATIAGDDVEKQRKIVEQAQATRPILYGPVSTLIQQFLDLKKKNGTAIEKQLYASMDESAFIDRLLINRPLMFMLPSDLYLLKNGQKGSGGFEEIGTQDQKAPLLLKDYLSYDEIQIAALLGVSVPTYFINDGDRNNQAQPAAAGTFEETGIYTGLVGARFERPNRMEWQHMIVTKEQNTSANGYGIEFSGAGIGETQSLLSLWSQLYGESFPTFQEAQADTSGRYIPIRTGNYLDSVVYKKRMKMVIEPFLIDANDRGAREGKKVYCHAVGLGLGVWQVVGSQAKFMLEVYADILKTNNFANISDIDFSWFPSAYHSCGGVSNGGMLGAVKIHFSRRNPAALLTREDKGKLLIAMYAWDGNAYPGNEYWDGQLNASGDPAAACCSTIPELQNPLINSTVSAGNLFRVGGLLE